MPPMTMFNEPVLSAQYVTNKLKPPSPTWSWKTLKCFTQMGLWQMWKGGFQSCQLVISNCILSKEIITKKEVWTWYSEAPHWSMSKRIWNPTWNVCEYLPSSSNTEFELSISSMIQGTLYWPDRSWSRGTCIPDGIRCGCICCPTFTISWPSHLLVVKSSCTHPTRHV